ncbi:MAG TPA: hypothetical protein VGC99_13455 [Candidatus Tectomicrobia bacterium]
MAPSLLIHIISHRAWLCDRLCWRYRDVEDRMAERWVIQTYEAVQDC